MAADKPEIHALFDEAVARDSAEDRSRYLDEACGDDPGLRGRVESLLRAHSDAGGFFGGKSPALQSEVCCVTEQPGTTIGPYKLLEQIGEGGMGIVFVAVQAPPVERKVALKIIKPGMDTREVLARFEAERQALALMDHPNIAKVLDGGATAAGRPYFVMELVKGIPITEFSDRDKLTVRQRLALFVNLCHGVQHAHQKGVIHRDLKPSNVLVEVHDVRPVPKIIDFGVAKAIGRQLTGKSLYTGLSQMVGTPLYMSPEQAGQSSLDVDTRSDIYSLGVLLYELLTGHTPFEIERLRAAGMDDFRRIIREVDPPRPSARVSTLQAVDLSTISGRRQVEPRKLCQQLRGELDWIVMKALEKDRNRRYETALGLVRDVERYLDDEPVQACPPSAAYRLRKFVRRNRVVVLASVGVLLALVAGIVGTSWGLVEARRQTAAVDLARNQAQKRLEQVEKSNEIVLSIFNDIDIRKIKGEPDPLEAVLAKRLVKVAEELHGEMVGDPLMVAQIQNRLGETLMGLGHAEAAIPLFVKARETFATELALEDPNTLTAMSNLGLSYQAVGQLSVALPLLEETLKLRKLKLGFEHPHTVRSMSCLGLAFKDVRKFDQALPLLEDALKLNKKIFGADDPSTLMSISNLGVTYYAADKMDLAVPLLEETLELRKKILGPDHFDTLTSMNNLGLAYLDIHKPDQALPLLEDALRLTKIKLGADHPHTLTSMNNLGLAYQKAGKPDLAVPLLEETLNLVKLKQGADHPHTLVSMSNLGLAYQAAGKPDLALPLFRESAAGMEKYHFQRESADRVVSNLIFCCELTRHFDEAERWRRKWMAVVRQRFGPDSTPYADELAMLSRDLMAQQNWPMAEEALRESLAIFEKLQPEVWNTFYARAQLGGALLGQKKYAEAEPLLLSGYKGMKQRAATIPPRFRAFLTDALIRLVQLYDAWGKADEAAIWRKELEARNNRDQRQSKNNGS
jgi:non-specific serine/threonine protein kinase/serine/threonine-protein kinase